MGRLRIFFSKGQNTEAGMDSTSPHPLTDRVNNLIYDILQQQAGVWVVWGFFFSKGQKTKGGMD